MAQTSTDVKIRFNQLVSGQGAEYYVFPPQLKEKMLSTKAIADPLEGKKWLDADELLAVCNEVRLAGRAEPLSCLLPGHPGNPQACLIAVNLNFSCSVHEAELFLNNPPTDDACMGDMWCMVFDDTKESLEIAKTVSEAMDWPLGYNIHGYAALILPKEVANAAWAFDMEKFEQKYYLSHSIL